MGQLDCNFCEIGEQRRARMYRLVKDLSREDLAFLLREDLIGKWLLKRYKKRPEK